MRYLQHPLYLFLLRASLLLLTWYVSYELWLKPQGDLDKMLSVNLTQASALFLRCVGVDAHVQHQKLVSIRAGFTSGQILLKKLFFSVEKFWGRFIIPTPTEGVCARGGIGRRARFRF